MENTNSGTINRAAQPLAAARDFVASDSTYRALFNGMAQGVIFQDAQGKITGANVAAEGILGLTFEQMQGGSLSDPHWKAVHEDQSNFPGETHPAMVALQSGAPVRNVVMGVYSPRDEEYHWLRVDATPLFRKGDGKPHQVFTIFDDITERVRKEQEIRFQSNLLDMVEQAVIATDLEGKIIYWSRFAEKLYGWTAKEVLGQNVKVITPSDATQAQAAEIMNRLNKGESWSGEFGVRKHDGTHFPAQVTDSPIYNSHRELIGVVGVSHDNTERKVAEDALAASEARFRALIEKSAEAFALLSPNGDIQYASPSVGVILGYDKADGIRNVFELVHPDDIGLVMEALGQIASQPGASVNLTVRERHKDGSWRWMECTATNLLHQAAVNAIVFNFRDVTARKQAEAETQQRVQEFAALYETAQLLAIQEDIPASLLIIAERAMSLLKTTTVAIHIYDPEAEDLELVAAKGPTRPVGSRLKLGEGIAGYIAQTRQAVNQNAYDSWTESALPLKEGLLNAIAGVPMLHRGELIGVLIVAEDSSPRLFTDSDVQLLSLFGSQAASAVYNARLLAQTRVRAGQLALLYDAGLELNPVLDPEGQLELLLKLALKTVSADRAVYYRFDPEHKQFKVELCIGYPEALDKIIRSRVFDATDTTMLVSRVGQKRVPLIMPDVTTLTHWVPLDPSVRSGIWLPVEHENELSGVIQLLSTRPRAFTVHDERLLMLFVAQAAVALKNARLFAQVSHHNEQLQALRTIDAAISGSLDMGISLEVVLEQVVTRLGVDAAAVLVLNQVSNTLEFAEGRGFRNKHLRRAPVRPDGSWMGAKLFSRSYVIRNAAELNCAPLMASEGFVSYAAIPLIAKGEVKGVLEVFGRTPFVYDAEWLDFFRTLAGQTAIAIDHVQLFQDLQHSNMMLAVAYDTTIEGWSRALDLRDKETEGHTQRVADMTMQLARAIGLADSELLHLRRGALLHDIGKMGVPDAILLKPGPLTDKEWVTMRRHPTAAYELLSPITFLGPALDIPYAHHEKWDGTGYPRGLKGTMIPQAARIFSVVDVWDALTSDRPYRLAWSKERAREYIALESGKAFDPQVVKWFMNYLQEHSTLTI